MLDKLEQVTVGFVVKEKIFVSADGKTVVPEGDKRAAFMKYAAGTRITPKQKEALIFPGAGAEPLPDAGQRSAAEVPDAANRRGKK
jgi:hypothetical protein